MILENEIALGGAVVPAGYQVERSLRFNSADSAYASWIPPQVGNRKTWTWSGWVKRSAITASFENSLFAAYASASVRVFFGFPSSSDSFQFYADTGAINVNTTAVFRDASAWYHVVLAFDSTQATAANRIKIYVNGVNQATSGTYPNQNTDWSVNNNVAHYLNTSGAATNYGSLYLTEVNFIDGLALDPTSFGEFNSSTGVWSPLAYTGSYGNNGFYLPFNDNSTVLNLGRNRQTLTADPYFPVTTLLLNGNGTNGAQNNTFLDSSTNNFTITRNGNTTQGTFSPFSQSGWSNRFNGSSDYLTCAYSTDFVFGTNDFTVECHMYITDASSTLRRLLALGNGVNGGGPVTSTWDLQYTGTESPVGQIKLVRYDGSTETTFATSGANIQAYSWVHVAVSRTGGRLRIFINGVAYYDAANSTNFASLSTDPFYVGLGYYGPASGLGGPRYFPGHLANIHVVNGTGLYSANFTPPTAPPTAVANTKLLTAVSNRFVDLSASNRAITVNSTPSVQAFSPFTPTAAYSAATNGGSGYFDGSGDSLSLTQSVLNPSGTSITIDFWFYPTATGTNLTLFQYGSGAIGDVQCLYDGGNTIKFQTGGNAGSNNTNVRLNQWNFITCTKDASNNFIAYVNGTTGTTVALTPNSTTSLSINSNAAGYMSGFRVTTGAANTPSGIPTAPPTTTVAAGTCRLLLNFTNAGIIDSTGKNVLETVGNAQISTTQGKWGGASMSFDGTTNCRVQTSSSASPALFNVGTGDYTAEMWLYSGTPAAQQTFFDMRNADVTGQGVSLSINTSRQIKMYYTADRIVSSAITANTWTHIAIVRANGVYTLYVNGVSAGTYANTDAVAPPANRPYIGEVGGGGQNFVGQIDDFRFSRFARYTGNFTVPAAQFAYNQADINVKQWVPTNFSVTAGVGNDSLVDSPTNYGTDTGAGGEVRGNYATLNPLNNPGGTFSNGNLDWTSPNIDQRIALSSLAIDGSSKWFCEFTIGSKTGTYYGLGVFGNPQTWNPRLLYRSDGARWIDSTQQGSNWSSYTSGDVIGVSYDGATGVATFYKNGTLQGSMTTSSPTSTLYFGCASDGSGGTMNYSANFGQRPFAYTAPSGFKALCTQNLPTPAIGASASTLARKNMNVVTYTGDGTNNRSITGMGFQPDLVWIKTRSTTYDHQLVDAVRGVGKELYSNLTNAESTNNTVPAFNADGFSVNGGTFAGTNGNGATFVGWGWKANGAGSSNTAGTISSTVSANASAGISVIGWTSTGSNGTVGHGLNTAPAFIIARRRNTAENWLVYHKNMGGNNGYLLLNGSAAFATNAAPWNSTDPTSSVFSINNTAMGAGTSNPMITYAFAEVPGFSKFGSYIGNGSADGVFVYLGFRARYIMIRRVDAIDDWLVFDTARDTYNASGLRLFPRQNVAEEDGRSANPLDILSNGFKARSTNPNASGGTYIYAAFAEAPFNYARAR